MATNFGNTYMEGSIEPSVRVQAPVQDDSGAVLANALAPAVGQIGAMVGSIFKGNQEAASNKILTDYEMELLDLGDAVSQGLMKKTEAGMQARALRRKYLGLAPGLRDDFDGVWTKFAGANGLGHITVTGTDEEQRRVAQADAAAALGYTPQEYELFVSRTRQATEINYELDLMQKQNLTISETQKNQGLRAITGMAQAAFPSAQRRINEGIAAIQANPENKAAIVSQINQVIGQGMAEVKHAGGAADTSYIVAPMQGALDTFNKWANGEVEATVLTNELNMVKLKNELMYTTDPILGPAIAKSKIIGEVGMANTNMFNDIFTPAVIARMAEMDNPTAKPNFLMEGQDITKVVEATKMAAGTMSADDVDGNKEIMNIVNKAVDSVYLNERGADSPMAYKEVIELLGSPEIKAVIDRNGGISSQYAKQFTGVLAEAYDRELLAASAAFLEDTDVTDLEDIRFTETGPTGEVLRGPVSDFIEPHWNGNGVEFVPKAGYEDNPNVVRLANRTTTGSNSIGDPLNSLIRAHANVSGTDPKTVYEETFADRLFGKAVAAGAEGAATVEGVEPGQTPTLSFNSETDLSANSSAKALSLSDFQPQELEMVVANTQAAEPQAVLGASSPVEFAQAFIGKHEGSEEDVSVLSSFIKQAAGLDINPAKTAWCAAFVDAILQASGTGRGTGKLNARSYLDWGKPVSEPQVGDVVVMWRESPDSWKGHVGFYAGKNEDGTIKVLGGNQSNSVGFANYKADTVLGYRRAQ